MQVFHTILAELPELPRVYSNQTPVAASTSAAVATANAGQWLCLGMAL